MCRVAKTNAGEELKTEAKNEESLLKIK